MFDDEVSAMVCGRTQYAGRDRREDHVMASVTLEEAQANLGGLIHQLAPGDELIVTEGNQPIARIVVPKPRVKLGAMRGSVVYMAPDFDAPLDDFKEYQE